MREPSSVDSRGGRTTVALLSLILLVAAVLAILAFRTEYAARDTAARVVRDYARVAAAELLSRIHYDTEYYGALPALRALAQWTDSTHSSAVPSRQEVAAVANPRQRDALLLVHQFFRFSWPSGACAPATSEAAEACHAIAIAGRASMNDRDIYFRRTKNRMAIAYSASPSDASLVNGFIVDKGGVGAFLNKAFGRAPLLPRTLGITNAALSIEITGPDGSTLFRSPTPFEPAYGLAYDLDSTDGELMAGSHVRSSIAAHALPRLVRGGVPQSHAGLLAVIFALTMVLTIAAIRQVSRERELAHMRSEFVASISHELRTPLTQIMMFSETLLLSRVRSASEERRSLEIIDQEARRLSHLVDNVLRMAQSERGQLHVDLTAVDGSRLVRETVEAFIPLARAAQASIDVRVPESIALLADQESLRQMLLNFLDNAVKYGPRPQTITVSLFDKGEFAQIAVDDQGSGIPEGERQRIWERYARLARDRSGHKAGTGIGLAVVRELATLHGGRVWSEPAPDGGSRFVLELRKAGTLNGEPLL